MDLTWWAIHTGYMLLSTILYNPNQIEMMFLFFTQKKGWNCDITIGKSRTRTKCIMFELSVLWKCGKKVKLMWGPSNHSLIMATATLNPILECSELSFVYLHNGSLPIVESIMCGPKKIISKIAIWVLWWRSFPEVSEPLPGSPPTKRRSIRQCEPKDRKRRGHPLHHTDLCKVNIINWPLHYPILVTRKAPHNTRCCGDVTAKSSPTQLQQLCSSLPHTSTTSQACSVLAYQYTH